MNWLRPLLMMFYAPARAMSEVRDRAPLALGVSVASLVWTAGAIFSWMVLFGLIP